MQQMNLIDSDSESEAEIEIRQMRTYRIRIDFANESEFYRRFRMNKRVFDVLLGLVNRELSPASVTPTALTAKDKLLLTLNFYGTNDPYFAVGDTRYFCFVFYLHFHSFSF